jgi:predicted phage gp36 major capsid-like protein
MIKKIKGEGLKKCLNEYQENTNKLDEIRKTMQDMKEEFNRDIEIFKKNQIELLEMKKTSVETLFCRMDQTEDRRSGLEDKV